MAVFYGLVGQVGDGVDRLAADNGGGFMEKLRYEELKAGLRAYAEGLDGGRAEMVVESDALGSEA